MPLYISGQESIRTSLEVHRVVVTLFSVVLYCDFRSLAFLGLFGFLIRQLKTKFIATLLSAAK